MAKAKRKRARRNLSRPRHEGPTDNLHVVLDEHECRLLLVRAHTAMEARQVVADYNGTSLEDTVHYYELDKWDDAGVIYELRRLDEVD